MNMRKQTIKICISIIIICFSICCSRADKNQYIFRDENNVRQYETLISVETSALDEVFHISDREQRPCTEEEERLVCDTIDLFFEELLRFNYALQKPDWGNILSLSDELHESEVIQTIYCSLYEYVYEHGADLNITSIKKSSPICFERDGIKVIKVAGVLNYRLLSFDSVNPPVQCSLSFGDNPIAFTIYVKTNIDNETVFKVIGWSIKRYNGIQENYYSEVLR